jgi:hypothetical protein
MGMLIRGVVFAALCVGGVVGVLVAHDVGRSALGALGGLLSGIVALMLFAAFALIVGVAWFGRTPPAHRDRRPRSDRDADEELERERA